jgi:Na+/Pi-cotransporter
VPALAVMLGANVGTTLIVQVLSFEIARFAPLLVLIGVVVFRSGRAALASPPSDLISREGDRRERRARSRTTERRICHIVVRLQAASFTLISRAVFTSMDWATSCSFPGHR